MKAFVLTLPLCFSPVEVPRFAAAVQQLEHARAKRQELRGLEGAARERARDAAVDAYRAVRAHHPEDRAAIAEAAFRAGELLRAAERFDEARGEFSLAVATGSGTAFRGRARLELGHLARRAGAHAEAHAAYLGVLADAQVCAHERDQALYWLGRSELALGREQAACAAWRQLADEALDPVDRVHAFDELGLAWLRRGDPEAAAGEWNRCAAALADEAREQTETGERVRNAFANMRTLRLMREAAQRRAARDAEREKK
jgi:hypothetical protein